jgi:hypothetical protein
MKKKSGMEAGFLEKVCFGLGRLQTSSDFFNERPDFVFVNGQSGKDIPVAF